MATSPARARRVLCTRAWTRNEHACVHAGCLKTGARRRRLRCAHAGCLKTGADTVVAYAAVSPDGLLED